MTGRESGVKIAKIAQQLQQEPGELPGQFPRKNQKSR
jgi:hypothetical protein